MLAGMSRLSFAQFCAGKRSSRMVKSPLSHGRSLFAPDKNEQQSRTTMTPRISFEPNDIGNIISRLREANTKFMAQYPGESERRQPVQTVYGGAHLFKA